jgi:hypothetical protein
MLVNLQHFFVGFFFNNRARTFFGMILVIKTFKTQSRLTQGALYEIYSTAKALGFRQRKREADLVDILK